VIADPGSLEPYRRGDGTAATMQALLRQQYDTWPQLRTNYDGLRQVKTRSLTIDGSEFHVQWNPGRIVSSSAKVDESSIRERPCFLCEHRLPTEQRGLAFGEDYLILCNPFPIFPEHFTIPHRRHRPQRIAGAFGSMLELSRAAGETYWVFYNGPKCGASAPDHLHFQAGSAEFLPITREYAGILAGSGNVVVDAPDVRVTAVPRGYLRSFIALESDRPEGLERAFAGIMEVFATLQPGEEEPLVNILSLYAGRKWRVNVFPRAKHRPSMFFAEGEAKILLSPAAVDLGGVLITPLEHDFAKMSEALIREVFAEICLSAERFGMLVDGIEKKFSGNPI
jgi:hypothetical protein